jgi:L-ascorbate metabolism protein UlaG (beta-lactamase superfamily)
VRITLIGGPTALLEIDGMRLLTDPTFDPAGSQISYGLITLRKTAGPVLTPQQLEPIDAVLLSHDQHADNLDNGGREFLSHAQSVFTTPSGAERLGGNAHSLKPWQSVEFSSPRNHSTIRITATPARHGPPGIESMSGEVIGFVIQPSGNPTRAIYVTGDTVWYEGVVEVAQRFCIGAVVLFAGAARVQARGPFHLTMNAEDAIATAHSFPNACIFPVHHHGWEHFSENQQTLIDAFAKQGLAHRLQPLELGVPTPLFK